MVRAWLYLERSELTGLNIVMVLRAGSRRGTVFDVSDLFRRLDIVVKPISNICLVRLVTDDICITSSCKLPKLKKRRGVVKALITRIDSRLSALEGAAGQPSTRDSVRQMLAKLKEHDADFRKLHLTIVDLTDDEGTLSTEQVVLDEHDDIVASLTVHVKQLLLQASNSSRKAIPASSGVRDKRLLLIFDISFLKSSN